MTTHWVFWEDLYQGFKKIKYLKKMIKTGKINKVKASYTV